MDDYETVRQKINDSVILKRNASNPNANEYYVSHVKIWETEGNAEKPRYIILTASTSDLPLIHKSRLNPNGTFSVGKTWRLQDLVSVVVTKRQEINITFQRSYAWQTENQVEQDRFLNQLVSLFEAYKDAFGPGRSLMTSGITTVAPSAMPKADARTDDSRRDLRSMKSESTMRERRSASRPRHEMPKPVPIDSPVPTIRPLPPTVNGQPFNGRVMSPTVSAVSSRAQSPVPASNGTRPSSPAPSNLSSILAPTARRSRRPSNATVSSITSSAMGQSSIPPPSLNGSFAAMNGAARSSRDNDYGSARRPSHSAMRNSRTNSPSTSTLDLSSSPSSYPNASAMQSSLSMASSTTSSIISQAPTEYNRARSGSSRISDEPTARIPSPAPSTASKRSLRAAASASATSDPPVPKVTKLGGSIPGSSVQTPQPGRRDANARISFYDPQNQVLLDRLLYATESARPPSPSKAEGEDEREPGADTGEWDDEGDSALATLQNIEEMLDGYEWIGEDFAMRSRKDPAEAIESRLLDELTLLDKANNFSLLESDDDRILKVLSGLDEAILELDNMDKMITSYKIHLNAVNDDIAYIQSQNRGLQVQTQNQQILLRELEKLLQTVQVDRQSLISLTQESLEKDEGIARLELAVTELYKALLASRDNDMAATMERLEEYRQYNNQFCKRLMDFLFIMFTAQGNLLLGENSGLVTSSEKGGLVILEHKPIELYLGRYVGLILYMKEMDESKYSKVCGAYFSAASDVHSKQVKALLSAYSKFIRQASEEESEQAFASSEKDGVVKDGLRRAGTVVRGNDKKERGKKVGGSLKPFEVLDDIFEQIAPLVYRERVFVSNFLLIDDAAITFAEYVSLDHFTRRQATQFVGLSPATLKLVRGAMDLIFGFLPLELKAFIDAALAKDNTQIVGVLAAIERAVLDAEQKRNVYIVGILEKQHQRLRGILDRHIDEQIKGVEKTKLDAKKRRGVAHFIKYFPVYVSRIENQLPGTEGLEIRSSMDSAYDRIVQSMFDGLRQIAKLDGDQNEDKGILNYHVILIENMHHFILDLEQLRISAAKTFKKRAEAIYDENLLAYVKLILRRPFARIIDFFEGVDRALKNTAPSEVSKTSSYNRSTLKRVLKDYDAKDIRKSVDALFKRVEKHFTDEETDAVSSAMAGVWQACQKELLDMTDLFEDRIKRCFLDTQLSLDYTKADVEAAFKRHKVG